MRIAIVRNPVAGGQGQPVQWAKAHAAFASRFPDLSLHETQRSGDASRLARELANQGVDLIIAAGGDGTISDVVDGILSSSRPQTPLTLLPLGTGCDFVRNFSPPRDCDALAEHVAATPPRQIDVLRLTHTSTTGDQITRYSANMSSVGISGEIVRAVNAPGHRKILRGPLRFLVHSVAAILCYRPYSGRVIVDGQEVYDGLFGIVAIANGAWFGGGMHAIPNADLADGLLDVAIMRQTTVLGLLNLLSKLYSASHVTHPKLSFHRGQRVEIIPNQPARFPVEVDGETPIIGGFSCEIVPAALTIRL
ncbi:YegS/Rv2252/BmrU family lipid kinase [Peteryoungia desertarenae]|uniref:YegS/Rv2252/BmrU family lipid kinase n=1 Tax=Peteryoungia desertarenae TaxID=1813451 RepID=A0ABX6QM52_9HYPH|nr:YegS/Rv2252/BmrU family lipid kinase [Peteryoungia desertarenae]QLF69683.1 YegS/Rv2252/BmrU family lipid kinase [Peteryoungia desertarenae]